MFQCKWCKWTGKRVDLVKIYLPLAYACPRCKKTKFVIVPDRITRQVSVDKGDGKH